MGPRHTGHATLSTSSSAVWLPEGYRRRWTDVYFPRWCRPVPITVTALPTSPLDVARQRLRWRTDLLAFPAGSFCPSSALASLSSRRSVGLDMAKYRPSAAVNKTATRGRLPAVGGKYRSPQPSAALLEIPACDIMTSLCGPTASFHRRTSEANPDISYGHGALRSLFRRCVN
jgi:hypothetical protein